MTANEITFLLWALGVLLSILAFIGALAVRSLMQMANDINSIKVMIGKVDVKHDELEKRVRNIEIAMN